MAESELQTPPNFKRRLSVFMYYQLVCAKPCALQQEYRHRLLLHLIVWTEYGERRRQLLCFFPMLLQLNAQMHFFPRPLNVKAWPGPYI